MIMHLPSTRALHCGFTVQLRVAMASKACSCTAVNSSAEDRPLMVPLLAHEHLPFNSGFFCEGMEEKFVSSLKN